MQLDSSHKGMPIATMNMRAPTIKPKSFFVSSKGSHVATLRQKLASLIAEVRLDSDKEISQT
jgi:hypothetical protein